MSQCDVFDWLKAQRKTGFDDYYSPKEVKEGMKKAGFTEGLYGIPGDLLALKNAGFLEWQLWGDVWDYQLKFRLKKKYINGV